MGNWADPKRRTELRHALVEAADKVLVNVFHNSGAAKQAQLTILAETLKELEPDEWGKRNHEAALRVAINRAVEELPDDERPESRYSSLSWREIGRTLYAFENVEAAGEGKKRRTYARQRQWVVDHSVQGWSASTYDREVFNRFYDLLADAFASLGPSTAQIGDGGRSRSSQSAGSSATLPSPVEPQTIQQVVHKTFLGRPLVVYLGRRFADDRLSAQSRVGEESLDNDLRALVQTGVIRAVITHECDLKLLLGDLLPFQESPHIPSGRVLWQLATPFKPILWTDLTRDSTPGEAVRYFLKRATSNSAGIYPALVVAGLSEEQERQFEEEWQRIERLTGTDGLFRVRDLHGTGQPSLSALLGALQTMSASNRLMFTAQHLNFDEPYSLVDILSGRGVRPGVAKTGFWPDDTSSNLDVSGLPSGVEYIRGASGAGKTGLAYRRAHELNDAAAHYLDLAQTSDVAYSDLATLIEWYENHRTGAAVILDNVQAARAAVDRLVNVLRVRSQTIRLILVETLPAATGGIADRHTPTVIWGAQGRSLAKWVSDQMPGLRDKAWQAAQDAITMWHFFYILRGGAASLKHEMAEASRDETADAAWFAIAAHQVFLDGVPIVRSLIQLLDEANLWPIHINRENRGAWLFARLNALLSRDLILLAQDGGYRCRHLFEANEVLSICCEGNSQLTTAAYVDVADELFRRALPSVVLPEKFLRKPNALMKGDLRVFADDVLVPMLRKLMVLEQAVPGNAKTREYVDSALSGFLDALGSWPIRNIYWMLTSSRYEMLRIGVPPFRSLKRLEALTSWSGDGDAVELLFAMQILAGQSESMEMQTWSGAYRGRQAGEERGGVADIHQRILESWDWSGEEPIPRQSLEERADCFLAYDRLRGEPDDHDTAFALRLADDPIQVMRLRRKVVEVLFASVPDANPAPSHIRQLVGSLVPEASLVDGLDRDEFTVLLASIWLKRVEGTYQRALANMDAGRIVKRLEATFSLRPKLVAHYWCLSRQLGLELVRRLQPRWRSEIVATIQSASGTSRAGASPLGLRSGDKTIALLASSVASELPELESWLATDSSGELGRLVRVVRRLEEKFDVMRP